MYHCSSDLNRTDWFLGRCLSMPKSRNYVCIVQSHEGCVNSLAWNAKGSLLISGSDDTRVCTYTQAEINELCCVW